jgi:hypothetical protein
MMVSEGNQHLMRVPDFALPYKAHSQVLGINIGM